MERGEVAGVREGGQAAGPIHCSRNARPQKALVGLAQSGPALLPARKNNRPPEGERNKEFERQRHPVRLLRACSVRASGMQRHSEGFCLCRDLPTYLQSLSKTRESP